MLLVSVKYAIQPFTFVSTTNKNAISFYNFHKFTLVLVYFSKVTVNITNGLL